MTQFLLWEEEFWSNDELTVGELVRSDNSLQYGEMRNDHGM